MSSAYISHFCFWGQNWRKLLLQTLFSNKKCFIFTLNLKYKLLTEHLNNHKDSIIYSLKYSHLSIPTEELWLENMRVTLNHSFVLYERGQTATTAITASISVHRDSMA